MREFFSRNGGYAYFMNFARRAPLCLAAFSLVLCLRAGAAEAVNPTPPDWINPWRNADGSLVAGSVGVASTAALANLAEPATVEQGASDTDGFVAYRDLGDHATRTVPRELYEPLEADDTAALDRGIDSADTKWRRQARTTGVRMRMLNGPEANTAVELPSSGTEKGLRHYAGAVVPLNSRWELAVLNRLGMFELKETGGKAGLESVTVRVGANPSVSFRPWFAVTPYTGLRDGDGVGVGISGGLAKSWRSGMTLEAEAFAFQPWDEGYETAYNDGRSHGFRVQGTMPVDRRLTITAGVEYEWLELGPHAPGGSGYAGRRGSLDARIEYLLLKRDSSYMGYGFRDQSLWYEQLVPIELGLFADVHVQRYIRPRGFDTLNPTEKSFRQRIGLFYNQAISPHLGFNAEAYVGQDPRRGMDPGDLYGVTFRLNAVVNPHLRFWCGWGFESDNDSLSGGGGPDRTWSMGMSYNF